MNKTRTYAVLASIAASISLLGACSDNDTDDLSDTGAAVESPATTTAPPATTPAPEATQTPPATSSAPETTQTPPAASSAPEATQTPATSDPTPLTESSDISEPGSQTDGTGTGDAVDDSVTDITPEPDSQ